MLKASGNRQCAQITARHVRSTECNYKSPQTSFSRGYPQRWPRLVLCVSSVGTPLQPRAVPMAARRGASVIRNIVPEPQKKAVPEDVIAYAKSLPGVTAPFPNVFDPVNLLGNAAGTRDGINEVKRWRESEVTHGRVAMLAALGFITQEQILGAKAPRPFPHVQGPAINHFQQVEAQGGIFWIPLLAIIALAESYRVSVGWKNPKGGSGFQQLEDDYEPGELGFDPLGLLPSDPQEKKDMQSRELNNGRLAMIAIAAFVAQELRVEKPIFANLNLAGTG
ncbi:hypothetical protein WJX73_004331 [Symbiochloris irregularis]|uniref:Chlorophyll a-b binding protein, chloroplastic n=1 Tax=Symbiochloris irregularis TaxID=706552 RepID=A0AAW1NQT4_9CHLO